MIPEKSCKVREPVKVQEECLKVADIAKQKFQRFKDKTENNQSSKLSYKEQKNKIEELEGSKKELEANLSNLQKEVDVVKEKIEAISKKKVSKEDKIIAQQLKVLDEYPNIRGLIEDDIEKINRLSEFLSKHKDYSYSKHQLYYTGSGDFHDGFRTLYEDVRTNMHKDMPFSLFGIGFSTHLKKAEAKIKSTISVNNDNDFYQVKKQAVSDEISGAYQKERSGISKRAQNVANTQVYKDGLAVVTSEILRDFQNFSETLKNWTKIDTLQAEGLSKEIVKFGIAKSKEDQSSFYPSTIRILRGIFQTMVKKECKYDQITKQELEISIKKFNDLLEEAKKASPNAKKRIGRFSEDTRDNTKNKAKNMIEKILDDLVPIIVKHISRVENLVSYYFFQENKAKSIVIDSLDQLLKTKHEQVSSLEDDITKLKSLQEKEERNVTHKQWWKSVKRHENITSRTQDISSTEKLREKMESSFQNLEASNENKEILSLYMLGLLKKFHPGSHDTVDIDKFHQQHFNEATEIAKYIEECGIDRQEPQKDAIDFAIHLKHAFGRPIHKTKVDSRGNIVQNSDKASTNDMLYDLKLDHLARILIDGQQQKVCVFAFRDKDKPGNSKSQINEESLLAIQALMNPWDPTKKKFCAGTPTPVTGNIDAKTGQRVTPEQPNLRIAAAHIETQQETQETKEIEDKDIKYYDKAAIKGYEIIAYTAKFTDRQNAVPSSASEKHTSEEYQETEGPYVVDMGELIDAVNKERQNFQRQNSGATLNFSDTKTIVKQCVAKQFIKKEGITDILDEEWHNENTAPGQRQWHDFAFKSDSLDMWTECTMLRYREELSLDKPEK